MAPAMASRTACSDAPGVTFALMVTCRVRPKRSICAGRCSARNGSTLASGTRAELVRGHGDHFQRRGSCASAIERTWTSYCSPRSV